MRRRYLAPAIAILIVCGLAASLVRLWRYSPYKVGRDVVGNPEVVLSLHDVEIAGRDRGKQVWSFNAKRVDVSRGRMVTTVTGIRDGKLYDEGKLVARVRAGRAVYSAVNGNVEVSDGVKLESTKGFRATADKALWTRGAQQLVCPGKVTFMHGNSKLVGMNLVADVRLGEVRLDKGRMVIDERDLKRLEDPGL